MSEQRRPRDLTPGQIGFSRARPVAWLAPGQLAGTAVRVIGALLFGAILDKRELQAGLPAEVYRHDEGDELWLDYVADIGDGFDATYSIAWLLAQRELELADPAPDGGTHTLPRGRVLVMGGDEVYPTPSWRGYENRSRGPYEAALPAGEDDDEDAPLLYALPGNHDWYDGLTAFLRVFGRGNRFGGWRTRQSRSYYALALPHRWWLFAIDEQLDAYLDEPQLRYFREAAAQLRPGDRVILCTPQPSWVYTARDPRAYDTVGFFVRTVIEPAGASVPVVLTGDLHHYARYRPADGGGAPRALITAGGGGAYLYPTHTLPERLTVPADGRRRSENPPRDYELAARFPSAERSRDHSRGIFARMLGRNPGFALVLGVLHTLLMLAFVSAGTRVLTAPVVALVAAVMAGAVAFAVSEVNVHKPGTHRLAGVLHGLAHLALAVLGSLVWWQLPLAHLPGPLPVLLAALCYLPVSGLAATELTAAYLLLASRFDVNVEESFAGQGIEDEKCFLRLHVTADGLTVHPVGLSRVGRSWVATPNAPDGAPWIAPARPLRPHLIEPPFRID